MEHSGSASMGAQPVPPTRPVLPRERVIQFLWRFGWLLYETFAEARANVTEPELEIALRAYQGWHGLEVDGWAGEEVSTSFEAPRFCGCPDVMPVGMELNRWPDPRINWWIDPVTVRGLGISVDQITAEFVRAWKLWSDTIKIEPRQVREAREAHVAIRFGAIDGRNGTLAWSELADNTSRQKEQRYDTAENWGRSLPLWLTAAHEIGHVLGIGHLSRGNLMQPTLDTRLTGLQAGDIAEGVARYGRATPAPSPAPVPPPEPPTAPPAGEVEVTLRVRGDIVAASIPGFRITPVG